jgi:hypothetical protein
VTHHIKLGIKSDFGCYELYHKLHLDTTFISVFEIIFLKKIYDLCQNLAIPIRSCKNVG